jgi:hypothetical protein
LLISASTIDSTEGDVSSAAAVIGAFIGFSQRGFRENTWLNILKSA